jgi:hypothetical protein
MCMLTRSIQRCLVVALLTNIAASCAAQDQESHESCSGLSTPGHYPDYQPVPAYRIDRRFSTQAKPSVLVLQISVKPESFDGSGVTRLGCKLNSDFPNEKHIKVLIFDDRKAAASLAAGFTDKSHNGTYLWHVRGRYELDRENDTQFIEYVFPVFEDQLLSLKRYKVWLKP